MRFFLDEGVPHSVGGFLQDQGFDVLYLEDKLAKGSPDMLVAAVSEANNAILVAFDADFKALASRNGIGQKRFKRLSLLRFEKCRESMAVPRLKAALSLIKFEWKLSAQSNDRRMFVVIQGESIRTHR
jgi:predicted nuclease of predicted toxin-antitoxin system